LHFPVYLRADGVSIHPHFAFELLAYAVALAVYILLRWRLGDVVTDDVRWWVIAAAVMGAAVGSRLLGTLEHPAASWAAGESGKTIVGGLAGGWVAVEWVKKYRGVRTATGDLLALPLVVGIAIGRVGCFLTGLTDQTYGSPTSLPWGVDFGDGIRRHPMQLYEIVFLTAMGWGLWRMLRGPHWNGVVFKAFMMGYAGWRLVTDFWKDDARWAGLSAIQWVCLGVMVLVLAGWRRVQGLAR